MRTAARAAGFRGACQYPPSLADQLDVTAAAAPDQPQHDPPAAADAPEPHTAAAAAEPEAMDPAWRAFKPLKGNKAAATAAPVPETVDPWHSFMPVRLTTVAATAAPELPPIYIWVYNGSDSMRRVYWEMVQPSLSDMELWADRGWDLVCYPGPGALPGHGYGG